MGDVLIDEPDEGSVIALHWGYPSQEIWVREPFSWVCANHASTSDWEQLAEQDEDLVLLIPANQDRYNAGWRDGRFELLRSLQSAVNELSEATYRHPR